MFRNPNPACTKTLKWRQPNERNVTGSSTKINFHSRWGKKNLSKSTKNVRNFTDVIRCMNACSNEQLVTQKRMREFFPQVFPTSFAVILSAVALPIVLKAEFNFELICTLPILFSKVQAAALNPLSVFKTLLKAHRSSRLRERKIIHKKSLRAPFTLHVKRTIQRYSQWLWVCTAL